MGKIYFLVDVECTGVNFLKDHVFDIGVIITDGKKEIGRYQRFITIDKKLLREAIENIGHIISIDIDLIYSEGKNIHQVCTEFMNLIYSYQENNELFFVGHNVDFDYNMILHTLMKAGKDYDTDNFENLFSKNKVDTIELAKYHIPGLDYYSLQMLIDKLNLCPQLSEKRKLLKHSALLDCELLLCLFHYLKSLSPFEDLFV